MKQFFLLFFSTAISFVSLAQTADEVAIKEAADQKINFTVFKQISAIFSFSFASSLIILNVIFLIVLTELLYFYS